MSQDDTLRLEVIDFTDPTHWRWRLTDAAGKFLSDFESVAFPDLETRRDTHARLRWRQAWAVKSTPAPAWPISVKGEIE
jgi:hypothetical protein